MYNRIHTLIKGEKMTHKFPSDGWIKELHNMLNESDSYQRSAKDWEGDFIFVVEADSALPETIYLYLQLYHGSSPGAAEVDPDNLPETEYTLRSPYTTWRKVVEGKLDPIQGMMTGQLKLKGDLMKIMRYPKAAQEIVACCAKVPTEW
jgi:putative sterol carrier protein